MDGRAINSSFQKKKKRKKKEPSIVPFKKKKQNKKRAINSFSLSGMHVKHVTLAGGEKIISI